MERLGGGGGGAFRVATLLVLRFRLPKLVAGDVLRSPQSGLPVLLAVSSPSSPKTSPWLWLVWVRLMGRSPARNAPTLDTLWP